MRDLPDSIDTPEKLARCVRVLGGVNDPEHRQVLGVRYPWAGWGHPTYAHRSLADGEYMPTTEPDPTRLEQSRKVLNVINSNREVFEVGFPIRLALKKWNKDDEEMFVHPWWNEELEHPIASHNGYPCPLPMSAVSVWPHYRTDINQLTPGNALRPPPGQVPFRWFAVARNAYPKWPFDTDVEWDQVDEYPQGAWQYDTDPQALPHRYSLRRRCTRILVYTDVGHNATQFTRGESALDFTSPDYIGRHMAKSETSGDIRFRPWGWTDQPVPEWTEIYRGLLNADRRPPLDYTRYHFSPYDSPPPGVTMGGDGSVLENADLSTISGMHLWAGFAYGGREWKKPFAQSRTHGPELELSEVDFTRGVKTFDIVIEANFYDYAIYRGVIGDGVAEDGYKVITHYEKIEDGYAGAYGRMFVIF